ncbi:DUF6483 family protein [Natronospora cellulosivora (SeqCode)]
MFEHDFIMRMIKDLAKFLALFLKKDNVDYVLPKDQEDYTETDYLYKELLKLLNQDEINKAENLLFQKLDRENTKFLDLAIDFYTRLNNFDDDYLEKNDFTRLEIEDGLKEIAEKFGISLKSFFAEY